MRIGYFGGSFDPPHRGHLAVATAAAEAFGLDQVLFVPTSHQPLKPERPTAPYADRLALVRLLCAEAPPAAHFTASDLEAPLPGDPPRYTVDTLEHLRSTLAPTDQLYVLVGADAFLQLPQWRSPTRLLELAEWIIVSRPGFDPARLEAVKNTLALTPTQRAHIHLLPTLDDPTSATALREALAAGISINAAAATEAEPESAIDGLPPTLLAYMRTHHLYGL